MIMIRVWIARLTIANRELHGIRSTLARLISATIALFLSPIGVIFVLTDHENIGLILVSISVVFLACAQGLSAIKTLGTVIPIIQRGIKK